MKDQRCVSHAAMHGQKSLLQFSLAAGMMVITCCDVAGNHVKRASFAAGMMVITCCDVAGNHVKRADTPAKCIFHACSKLNSRPACMQMAGVSIGSADHPGEQQETLT